MSHRHENPTVPARVQVIRVDLLVVHNRHKKIGMEKQEGPVELRRRYPEDGKRMLVHLNPTAHHATIILEMGVPIRVGEHDIRSAVRAMLIGGVKEMAKIRLKA